MSSLFNLSTTKGQTRNGSNIACLLVIILPFLYYLYLVQTTLWPFVGHDSFSYLWDLPISTDFFTNRSLTQRSIFFLLGNKPHLIAVLQTTLFCATALIVFSVFRTGAKWRNLTLALIIAFCFSSYTISVFGIAICSEPVYLALFLSFSLLYCYTYNAEHNARVTLLVLCLGVAFIFSKNIAPFTTLILVCSSFLLRKSDRFRTVLNLIFISLSLLSIFVTQHYDSSVNINIANNLYIRVFPYPERVELFSKRFNMPVGDFIKTCAGGNVNTPCINGRAIYTVDQKRKNYRLERFRHPLIRWIKRHGSRSMTSYFLFYGVKDTYKEFSLSFAELFSSWGFGYGLKYMDFYKHTTTGRSNLDILATINPNSDFGFWGIEPLDIIRLPLLQLGWGSLSGVFFYLVLGILIGKGFVLNDKQNVLILSSVCLTITSLASIFLGLFGDGMDPERHSYISLLVFIVAASVLSLSLASEFLLILRARFQSRINH